MFKIVLKIIVSMVLIFQSFSCCADEIYKSVDENGNVSFSSIAPLNSRIVQTVSVKKLIKKISVINGAAAQSEKIKAITKELTESRLKRNKKAKKVSNNYNDEIALIKDQRLEGLRNLSSNESALNTSSRQQIKDSIRKMHEQSE